MTRPSPGGNGANLSRQLVGDWMNWLRPQSGKLVKAGPVATKAYPALADAPGTYVLEA